jgi:regulator of sigma E protease
MSEPKVTSDKYFRAILFVIIIVAVLFLIARNINTFGNVLLVLLGFGAVVLVHEFGHFIVAKLSGIKVEAFSIFMPPVLLGLQKTENGYRFRILPEIFPKEGDESGEGSLSFTVGKKGPASETEYRIGLIPFGGFVKMLGQDDVGPVKTSDDPRSYANKPVLTRAAVLAAGVTFNVISAGIIFMTVFLIGIDLPPAVVGDVLQDSPAAQAGLRAGDEIIEIAGKSKDLDFSNIGIAAALSGEDEEVPLKVRHTDGSEEELTLTAVLLPGEKTKAFGIEPAQTLTIAKLSKNDADILFEKTGLRPGDRIKAINGTEVQNYWELKEAIKNTFSPEAILLAERNESGSVKQIESRIALETLFASSNKIETESELSNIYSMVPRLRIKAYSGITVTAGDNSKLRRVGKKLKALTKIAYKKVLSLVGIESEDTYKPAPPLQEGDIIIAIGDVNNPTYTDLRECLTKNKDMALSIKVLRADANGLEKLVTETITPKQPKGRDKVLMGALLTLDTEHAVIADTIPTDGNLQGLAIPSGSTITAVDGVQVSNFYDIAREIGKYTGQRITIDYRLNEEVAGNVPLEVDSYENRVDVISAFAEYIPFENLKRPYKANGPVNALIMGYRKTIMFIAQTYVTLKCLISGLVSPENLMGPLGIITFSYRIVAEQPLVYYVYFLGLISAVIAVFNFLPLPPLDGGLVVLLIVEKIKGSALSEKAQGIIAYTGWALILTLILYVTFNDIVRSFF